MADAPAGRYLVTARKYRPQTFADLVAQEHVAQTLQNAILHDRLAQAYLFSGPRGVGKTTAARLVAKAINCTTPLSERTGAEPCRACDSCRAFEEGRSLNIIEVDAASNNRVDDIRDLREKVRIPPQGARKKIYILDEVHMLSQGAFNALLKTLEEPPPHVLFIFATTEPHKVLPTILSRTQRFDFRRIAVPEIVSRLQHIAHEEGITADAEALMLLARKGDGALRDALSIFDQAVSLCGTDLRYDALADALGVVDTDLFFETTALALAHDRAGMLRLVDRLMARGYDLTEYLAGLAEHLRDLLAVKTTGDGTLIEATDAVQARYVQAAGPFAEADLLRMLMIADETEQALKMAPQPRLKLELALLKLASLAKATDLTAVLAKLERLEAALASGTLDGGAVIVPGGSVAVPDDSIATPSGAAGNAPGDGSASPAPTVAPAPAAPTSTHVADSAPDSTPSQPDTPLRPEPVLPPELAAPASGPSAVREPATAPAAALTPATPSLLVEKPVVDAPPASREEMAPQPTPSNVASLAPEVATPTPAPEATPATSVSAATEPVAEVPEQAESPAPPPFDDGRGDLPPIDAYDDFGTDEDGYSASELPTPLPAVAPSPPAPPSSPVPSSSPVTPAPAASDEADEPHRPPVGGDATPLFPGLFDPPALNRPPSSLGGDGSRAMGDGADVAIAVPADLPGADDFGVSLGRVQSAWGGLHARVKADRVHIAALLSNAQPQRVHRGAVEVVVADDFTRTLLTSETDRLAVHLAAELGTDADGTPALRFVVAAPEALPETAAAADPFEAFKRLRQSHPVVRLLFERFGAEIVY
ncbi:MAG: DNA polymerase III subunit gamma/tau [Bacteroidota bacterium]